jgi:hypothetical protein
MNSNAALIGHTGFVGSNLLRQRPFASTYNSTSIDTIDGQSFTEIVCAGVIAVKWWANQNADEDLRRIQNLIGHLDRTECERFTLISTVDVYGDCQGVTEDTPVQRDGLHAYGDNRAYLEDYVRNRFKSSLIMRLPALFGPGLKKNAIYDLLHDNRLSYIHPNSTFQWYSLARLAADLDVAWSQHFNVINLSVEPVAMSAIAERFFPGKTLGGDAVQPGHYDMMSKHAAAFGGRDGYVVTADAMMDALGDFLQSQDAQ